MVENYHGKSVRQSMINAINVVKRKNGLVESIESSSTSNTIPMGTRSKRDNKNKVFGFTNTFDEQTENKLSEHMI